MAAGWLNSVDDLANLSGEDRPIVVLPLGATEQHGNHLPLETDSIIAEGICNHLIKALPGNMPVHFLPVERIGYSVEHLDHEGTQSLTWQQATERWIGLGNACANHGITRFVMLNAHGGNSPLMTVVAQELRVLSDMIAVATSWTRFTKNSGIVSKPEEAYGIHGGDIETSVMLALRPDLVEMGMAENFRSLQEKLTENHTHLRAYGPHAFGWKAADLNETGVVGNASAATAEKGELLIARAVEGLVELLGEVRNLNCRGDALFHHPCPPHVVPAFTAGISDANITFMSTSWVYIMTNRPHGVLYTGVTSDLPGRVFEHKNRLTPGFTSKYKCFELAWFETHSNIVLAIKREKVLKNYQRDRKVDLIESLNPSWVDLTDKIFELENVYVPHKNSPNYDDYF